MGSISVSSVISTKRRRQQAGSAMNEVFKSNTTGKHVGTSRKHEQQYNGNKVGER